MLTAEFHQASKTRYLSSPQHGHPITASHLSWPLQADAPSIPSRCVLGLEQARSGEAVLVPCLFNFVYSLYSWVVATRSMRARSYRTRREGTWSGCVPKGSIIAMETASSVAMAAPWPNQGWNGCAASPRSANLPLILVESGSIRMRAQLVSFATCTSAISASTSGGSPRASDLFGLA